MRESRQIPATRPWRVSVKWRSIVRARGQGQCLHGLTKVGLAPVHLVRRGILRRDAKKRKYDMQQYRVQHLLPRVLQAVEHKWHQQATQTFQLEQHLSSPVSWSVADLASAGTRLSVVRSWAQLRLQKCFLRSPQGEAPLCRLCGMEEEEVSIHLLSDCYNGGTFCQSWAECRGIQLPLHREARLQFVMGCSPKEFCSVLAEMVHQLAVKCNRAVAVWRTVVGASSSSSTSSLSSS